MVRFRNLSRRLGGARRAVTHLPARARRTEILFPFRKALFLIVGLLPVADKAQAPCH
jgi:hypothetical protein